MAAGNDGNEGNFTSLPWNMQKLVKSIGFANFETGDEEEKEVYDRARTGHCMTCGKECRQDANVIINRFGIVAMYCGGQCHSDMAVMGFLQEQHDDIISAIKVRGSSTPQFDQIPPETDDEGV